MAKIVLLSKVRGSFYPCGFRASHDALDERDAFLAHSPRWYRNFSRGSAFLLCAVVSFALASCSQRRAPRALTPKLGTRAKGIASWYGDPYHGRATASGEIYNMELGTAAHRRYAFGTWVRVDNLDNGQHTDVRINDRGPFVRSRIIDLSRASARQIGMLGPGIARVRLTVIAPPPMTSQAPPSPSTQRAATVTPAAAPRGSRWDVQVAAYRSQEVARQQVSELIAAGQRAEILPKGSLWRVIVLSSDGSEKQAHHLLDMLAPAWSGAFVVRQDTQ